MNTLLLKEYARSQSDTKQLCSVDTAVDGSCYKFFLIDHGLDNFFQYRFAQCNNKKISAEITAVEVTQAGKKVKINEINKVEREIMTCLSKRFSLTNDNSTMEDDFTSKIGYLAKKESA